MNGGKNDNNMSGKKERTKNVENRIQNRKSRNSAQKKMEIKMESITTNREKVRKEI